MLRAVRLPSRLTAAFMTYPFGAARTELEQAFALPSVPSAAELVPASRLQSTTALRCTAQSHVRSATIIVQHVHGSGRTDLEQRVGDEREEAAVHVAQRAGGAVVSSTLFTQEGTQRGHDDITARVRSHLPSCMAHHQVEE